jgi:hypothetical protein
MPAVVRIPGKAGRISVSSPAERTYGGRTFHSKAEAAYAAELDLRKRVGEITDWWPQVRFPILIGDIKICDVVVDFKILEKGLVRHVEIKGHETEAYRLKKKLMAACYPTVHIEVVYVGGARKLRGIALGSKQ